MRPHRLTSTGARESKYSHPKNHLCRINLNAPNLLFLDSLRKFAPPNKRLNLMTENENTIEPIPRTDRKIIHVDMDMFFAAVEIRDDPSLKGKPIAVGGGGDRGVVSTASYEARKFGVHSAMSTRKALELCPELILIEGHHDKYKQVSQQIHEVFREYTDLIEPISLDEAFLDVTKNKPNIELAQDIAKEIKAKILKRTGLTASAGVSYCKFLAKIGSDWKKPDGLTVIHPDKALDFIAALPIERFWGVGEKTKEKMHHLGIGTGLQLRQRTLSFLTYEFGKIGRTFWEFSRGIDLRPVVTDWVRKSVGCEHTLEKDIKSNGAITIELYHVCIELIGRIKKEKFKGHTLTLKIKYEDFKSITRSQTCKDVLTKKEDILPLAKELMRGVEHEKKGIRLIGLSVSGEHTEEDKGDRQLYFDFWYENQWNKKH